MLNGTNKRHFLGGGWVGKSGNLFSLRILTLEPGLERRKSRTELIKIRRHGKIHVLSCSPFLHPLLPASWLASVTVSLFVFLYLIVRRAGFSDPGWRGSRSITMQAQAQLEGTHACFGETRSIFLPRLIMVALAQGGKAQTIDLLIRGKV